MDTRWFPRETDTHQDHVIAHVIGTTVLGYFEAREALHLLLDIGFIWTIYPDCDMGLLPQSVAISELGLDEGERGMLLDEIGSLQDEGPGAAPEGLKRVTPAPVRCLIEEVRLDANDEGRRLLLRGEEASLAVETSLTTGLMSVEVVAATEE